MQGKLNREKKNQAFKSSYAFTTENTLCTNPELLNSQEKEFWADKNHKGLQDRPPKGGVSDFGMNWLILFYLARSLVDCMSGWESNLVIVTPTRWAKRSIVCLSRWLAGLLSNRLACQNAGYWNPHKEQPPGPGTSGGRAPARGTGHRARGIFFTVICRVWSKSRTGVRKPTGRSVAGMENVWLYLVELWALTSPHPHTNILPASHAFSTLSSFTKFNALTEFEVKKTDSKWNKL